MFETIDYLRYGNEKQKNAYEAINSLALMEKLSDYNPILCGTLPIGIDIEGSDLDIIMEVFEPEKFERKIKSFFYHKENFIFKNTVIRNTPVAKANFFHAGFEFELFGQPQSVKKQYAYLHMVIEKYLITNYPSMKEEVLVLKRSGMKTEPAFCKVLGLEGDPFEVLIDFGKKHGVV